jgi:hypothetical protein
LVLASDQDGPVLTVALLALAEVIALVLIVSPNGRIARARRRD